MDTKKKKILEELENQNGIVSTACNNVGMPRSTFYKWCQDDAEFKAAVDEIQEVAIDYVESKLFEKINGVSISKYNDADGKPAIYDIPPSDTAIIFYLKTKAKSRGYVEKTEHGFTDKDGNDIKPVVKLEIDNDCQPLPTEPK